MKSARVWAGRGLFVIVVAVLLFYTLAPFAWAVLTAVQDPARIIAIPADYTPLPPTGEHYRAILTGDQSRSFLLGLRNSAAVAAGVTGVSLLVGALAACALARYHLRGRHAILALILAMTIFPQITVVGAVRDIVVRLGLYNTLPGLGLSYLLFTLPFTIWVLTSFFRGLPRELEESAYVDGASPWTTFWRVLLPLSLPGLATTGLLAFIAAWNEYLFALTLTATPAARTVPVVIANFGGASQFSVPWGQIMAACVVVTLPLVILVAVFQRWIVAGLTAGAVKG